MKKTLAWMLVAFYVVFGTNVYAECFREQPGMPAYCIDPPGQSRQPQPGEKIYYQNIDFETRNDLFLFAAFFEKYIVAKEHRKSLGMKMLKDPNNESIKDQYLSVTFDEMRFEGLYKEYKSRIEKK